MTANTESRARTGGQILVDQLAIHGVKQVFCVPGESYLAALDALHDSQIGVTVCRQEGGAAMMAEAQGKLTGVPGICFVTRGPGATNASAGVHIAMQDSTPMILFVGQIAREMRGREAFQELDYRAVFGTMAKWAVEIDEAARMPEIISRAFHVATSGRPGPVVIGLPEDMLVELADVPDARRYTVPRPAPTAADVDTVLDALAAAQRPLVIAGGSRWTEGAVRDLVALSDRLSLPVAVSFRRQMLFPNDHPNYVGDLSTGPMPALSDYVKNADTILLLGSRLSEIASQSYTLFDIPVPKQKLIHVHPDPSELGRVYQPDLGIACAAPEFLSSVLAQAPVKGPDRESLLKPLREALVKRSTPPAPRGQGVDLGAVMTYLNEALPRDSVITNGAGNYATWVHRFYKFRAFNTQAAPTSGSMGYGVPAAIGAARLDPSRRAVAFAGDGCFLMHGQEFATAVQYDLPVIIVVCDNGMFGTIRMHQEREYPSRVVATDLKNPDFAAYAKAFGGHGERVEKTEDFAPAFERAMASGKPAILHLLTDPDNLTVDRTLSQIRGQ
ncbi:thiamine pyrophosphate-binding protein [Chachezhania sediminis]|uniref:thiamine pyrophosphate-binding protein n=1 Tax=Chachezhania sediminis TaxID=2599291 RepID=UPI00131C4A02|nr:thiamine pyrophosphate-binding protein [Chachezhania sediminis]